MSGFKGYPPSVQVGVPFPEDVCVRVNSEIISDNIRHSISLGLQQVTPHVTQWGKHICLVTGGPSLNESFDIVRERYEDGVPIVTVNGTYNYCMDSGIIPSAFIMLDSREFNKRFIEHPVDNAVDIGRIISPFATDIPQRPARRCPRAPCGERIRAIHLVNRDIKLIEFRFHAVRVRPVPPVMIGFMELHSADGHCKVLIPLGHDLEVIGANSQLFSEIRGVCSARRDK